MAILIHHCLLLTAAVATTATAFILHNVPSPNNSPTKKCFISREISKLHASSSSSVNPNDMETPEERQERMEMVKRLQKTFYQDESGITKRDDGIYEDVPLWRVQWTELPGYQNVLNCHVPHYTHMFMKVLNGPKPWYFGHIYLPDGSKNLDNPDYFLCDPISKAAHIGTLMKVSDYRQLDDGRLLLIAQALGKFKILESTQHIPYAIAKIELTPDLELVSAFYDEAMELALDVQQGGDKEEEKTSSDYDVASACWDAARVGAVTEAIHWESFEYRDVAVDECLEGGSGVSPIANFDATQIPMDESDVAEVMKDFLSSYSSRKSSTPDTRRPVNRHNLSSDYDKRRVLELEREVWIGVDFMIQLIAAINKDPTMHIPVPTQLLGLLPSDQDWPKGFQLDAHAARLSREKAYVGTMSKSPFVAVDDATASSPSYPLLRRAQRLSFVIWCLMDNILAGYVPAAQTRQSLLELDSTTERLEAAKRGLDAINTLLRKTLEGR